MLKANTSMYSPTYVFNCLRKYVPESFLSEVRRMSLTMDGTGAVFDVPHWSVEAFIEEQEGENFTVEILDSLPELQVKLERSGGDNRSFGGRGGGFGGRGGGWGGGGRLNRY